MQVNLGYAADQAVVKLTQPKSKLVEATMLFPLGLVLESEHPHSFWLTHCIMFSLQNAAVAHSTHSVKGPPRPTLYN